MTLLLKGGGVTKITIDSYVSATANIGGGAAGGRVVVTDTNSVAQFRDVYNSNYIEVFTTEPDNGGYVGLAYTPSDIRKKQNIESSTFDSLSLIKNLEFIQFDWKKGWGTGHRKIGISAQQLKELDDESVSVLSDGYLLVRKDRLMLHIAKAIQQLNGEFDTADKLIDEINMILAS